jgi:hypothetical protein
MVDRFRLGRNGEDRISSSLIIRKNFFNSINILYLYLLTKEN